MLKDVIEARPVGGYRLYLRFDDGRDGAVDVASLVELTGVFGPLRDSAEFEQVRVDPELGTIVWPCGADLDPDVLYSVATGQPIGFVLQSV